MLQPDQGWLFLLWGFTERAEEYPLPEQDHKVTPSCDSLAVPAQTKLENLELKLSQTQGTFTSCLKDPAGSWLGQPSQPHLSASSSDSMRDLCPDQRGSPLRTAILCVLPPSAFSLEPGMLQVSEQLQKNQLIKT